MQQVTDNELDRQFRVLRQILDMHSRLRDFYARISFLLDLFLLISSGALCGIIFTTKDIWTRIGWESFANNADIIIGFFSIFIFCLSLLSLKADWKGKSTRHADAVQKSTRVLSLFRKYRSEENKWDTAKKGDLHKAYWELFDNIIEIPSSKFNALKNKYLKKVELSKLSGENPGCSLWMLKLLLLCRSTKKCFSKGKKENNGVCKNS